jgi:hypothetical protein
MRNTLLGLAIVATLTIASCKQETKDKVEKQRTLLVRNGSSCDTAVKVDAAIDSTKSKLALK